jgi:hypothetical protein
MTPAEHIRGYQRYTFGFSSMMLGWGVVSILGGIWALTSGIHEVVRAGFALVPLGIPFITSGFRWMTQTRRGISAAGISGAEADDTLREYWGGLEKLVNTLRRTRNAGALWLLISVLGLVMSCVISRWMSLVSLWLVVLVQCALLTTAAYYHVFRTEIHLHEIGRSPE